MEVTKGFIEVETADGVQYINTAYIIRVIAGNLVLNELDETGQSIMVMTSNTNKEIMKRIRWAQE